MVNSDMATEGAIAPLGDEKGILLNRDIGHCQDSA